MHACATIPGLVKACQDTKVFKRHAKPKGPLWCLRAWPLKAGVEQIPKSRRVLKYIHAYWERLWRGSGENRVAAATSVVRQAIGL